MADEKVTKINTNIKKENEPIQLNEIQKLKFENAKLKVDIAQANKQLYDYEILTLTTSLNKEIANVMTEMKIPNNYRLDFSTFAFIVPHK